MYYTVFISPNLLENSNNFSTGAKSDVLVENSFQHQSYCTSNVLLAPVQC